MTPDEVGNEQAFHDDVPAAVEHAYWFALAALSRGTAAVMVVADPNKAASPATPPEMLPPPPEPQAERVLRTPPDVLRWRQCVPEPAAAFGSVSSHAVNASSHVLAL